jgi:hypothetical protein
MIPDLEKLKEEGWTRRNVFSEPRLGELVAMYEELGLEVLLIPVISVCRSEGEEGTCTTCFEGDADPDRYKVIFTRPVAGTTEDSTDLF